MDGDVLVDVLPRDCLSLVVSFLTLGPFVSLSETSKFLCSYLDQDIFYEKCYVECYPNFPQKVVLEDSYRANLKRRKSFEKSSSSLVPLERRTGFEDKHYIRKVLDLSVEVIPKKIKDYFAHFEVLRFSPIFAGSSTRFQVFFEAVHDDRGDFDFSFDIWDLAEENLLYCYRIHINTYAESDLRCSFGDDDSGIDVLHANGIIDPDLVANNKVYKRELQRDLIAMIFDAAAMASYAVETLSGIDDPANYQLTFKDADPNLSDRLVPKCLYAYYKLDNEKLLSRLGWLHEKVLSQMFPGRASLSKDAHHFLDEIADRFLKSFLAEIRNMMLNISSQNLTRRKGPKSFEADLIRAAFSAILPSSFADSLSKQALKPLDDKARPFFCVPFDKICEAALRSFDRGLRDCFSCDLGLVVALALEYIIGTLEEEAYNTFKSSRENRKGILLSTKDFAEIKVRDLRLICEKFSKW